MILADWEIIQALVNEDIMITPLINAKKQIGSCSVDLRLGTEFKLIRITKQTHFDLSISTEEIKKQIQEYTEIAHVLPMEPFILHPDEFALASTLEYIILPNNITGKLEGRSTWGRVGLQIHSTAGLVDAGFEGTLTYELHNMGKLALPLYPGIRIAQISFYRCKPVFEKYVKKDEAKYAKFMSAKSSMFFDDYEYKEINKHIDKMKMKKKRVES